VRRRAVLVVLLREGRAGAAGDQGRRDENEAVLQGVVISISSGIRTDVSDDMHKVHG
jgi:hypothetical protein